MGRCKERAGKGLKIYTKVGSGIVLFLTTTLSVFAIPGDNTHEPYTCDLCTEYVNGVLTIDQDCIKSRHTNHDITVFGDSLSEFILNYGNQTSAYFGVSVGGGYGGNDLINIDSWSDYFTIFGGGLAEPFNVLNYAQAGSFAVGWFDQNFTGENKCNPVGGLLYAGYKKGPTAAHSLLMIGGNDNRNARIATIPFLPFVGAHVNTQTLGAIEKFIDWNLENGKNILLQGNLPTHTDCYGLTNQRKPDHNSGCIDDYNNFYINRESLCAGGGPKPPPIPEIPWWYWFIPGAGEALINAYKAQLAHVIDSWRHFGHKVGEKYSKYELSFSLSVAQACLNDRIGRELMPKYREAGYGSRVFYHPLYDHFSVNPNYVFAKNFWESREKMFEDGDEIHLGPWGYKHWAEAITPTLHTLGWNRPGAGQPAINHTTAIPAGLGHPAIFAIVKSVAGSGKVEIHTMNGGTRYQNWLSRTATLLHEVGDNTAFMSADFNRDGAQDVAVVLKLGTGSGKTEVHVMNGATNFQSWLIQEVTLLHPVGDNVEFVPLDFNRDGVMDIAAIIKSGTGTGTTEIHVMDGANGFKSWLHQDRTPLHPTGAEFRFVSLDHNRDGFMDITAIKQSGTGTKTTEIHVLDGANGFRNWIFQDRSALGETDELYEFISGDFNRDGIWDIAAIKKRSTGSGTTEVSILDGASNFAGFLLENYGTILPEIADNYTFATGN